MFGLLLASAACSQEEASKDLWIKTFPRCKVFCWTGTRPEASPLGYSNSKLSVKSSARDGFTKLIFVYGEEADAMPGDHVLTAEEQTHFSDRSLSRQDMSQSEYPLGPIPIFLLTTPARWRYFLLHEPIYWLVPTALLGLVLLGWRRRRRSLPNSAEATASMAAKVGRFELGKSLGKGGAGEVFAAVDDQGEKVAVKLLHSNLQDDPQGYKRFLREVQICSKLNHPNVVKLIDWGQQEDLFYLAMELLEGESLGESLRRRGPLSPSELLAVLKPLASALQALHDLGLLHRDIKPDNIFLRSRGAPALMDFGIATGEDLTRATRTGLSLGTPTYMSPEQIRGQAVAASDQYSLGVLAFVCLTGKRPFEADDPVAMAYQHVHGVAPTPSSLRPELAKGIDSVVLKMLAKHPADRYSSVTEAVQRLEEAICPSLFLEEATQETEL